MTDTGITEYRIEHLRDRLAHEETAELGVRVETHGSRAVVRGRVPDEQCRTAVLRLAEEELAGLDWYEDLTVSHPQPPDHSEDLP
ncbi:BON domain-containing protein [Streptomyces sp. AP-93]|uniref:BON domain-containing protein n=1 Tax=Streptomyces sp. AP-93 TaxID=2929048 RepID=UPI001FAEC38B|nr:BON domain-containing protein [Streptomyces sp. AP-93]MCJ0869731.1 BON domain-containing protein [Streptomyces sp. AP-93]